MEQQHYEPDVERDLRDEIRQFVGGFGFPKRTRDLMEAAQMQGVSDELRELLEQLPPREYEYDDLLTRDLLRLVEGKPLEPGRTFGEELRARGQDIHATDPQRGMRGPEAMDMPRSHPYAGGDSVARREESEEIGKRPGQFEDPKDPERIRKALEQGNTGVSTDETPGRVDGEERGEEEED